MTQFLFANNASTTLASSVAPTDTVIQVLSGTGSLFPTPGPGQQFAMTFQDAATGVIEEICYCTARSGDSFTVVRGQEGTAARTWAIGDHFSNYWTAGSAGAFVQLPILQSQATNFALDTSVVSDAMTISLNPSITAYSQLLGSPVRIFKNSLANVGHVTVSINGIGPLPVVFPGGLQLTSGFISGHSIIEIVFDGTQFEIISIGTAAAAGPSGPAGGDLAGTYPNPVVGTNKISNGKLAQMPADSIKSNLTSGVANAVDNTITAVAAAMGIPNLEPRLTGNLATLGHVYLPVWTGASFSNLLINWGFTGTGGGSATATFDQAFSSGPYSVAAVGNVTAPVTIENLTTTSMKVNSGSPNTGAWWIVIGPG